jgi:hypothetical protein
MKTCGARSSNRFSKKAQGIKPRAPDFVAPARMFCPAYAALLLLDRGAGRVDIAVPGIACSYPCFAFSVTFGFGCGILVQGCL